MHFGSIIFNVFALLAWQTIAIPAKRAPDFRYGVDKVRGLNIGGWLVLEPWITPSVFQQFVGKENPAVDEYTFCERLGQEEAQKQLTMHWDRFYNEFDFERIASYGINHVRIPIGYWAFDIQPGEPWVAGAADYLDRAIGWAAKYDMRVWIDLHGGPGSQNGFDNSGRAGPINWPNEANIARTLRVLKKIIVRYGGRRAVTGIAILNEPAGFAIDVNIIKSFYERSYPITRSRNRLTVISDAFTSLQTWTDSFGPPKYQNIGLDTHIYQVFSPGENSQTHRQHLQNACGNIPRLAQAERTLWTVVGEWSAAENDCAQWLNGFGKGARYDGSFPGSTFVGSCADQNNVARWSTDKKEETREFIAAQLDAYETGAGWFFWTAKTETASAWDFGALVANGLVPQPLSARQPGFCNSV